MAYLQLTTRCNMECPHCCFAATTKGESMTHEVFILSLQHAIAYSGLVTLGGGEPTTHKHFFEFLDKAIQMYNKGLLEMTPLVITNGKLKGKALKLLDYVEGERGLQVELSQDEWHDPIDPEVVRLFKLHQKRVESARLGYQPINFDNTAGVRTVGRLVAVGRAADPTRGLNAEEGCCCEDLLYAPDGTIYSCGCKHTVLGSVFDNPDLSWFERDYAHTGGREPDDL